MQKCSSCGNETLVPTESIYLVREVFLKYFQSIYDTFQANNGLEKLSFFNKIPSLKRSAELEMGLYLLFRLDFIISNYQTDKNRCCIHALCIDAIIPEHNNHIYEIVDEWKMLAQDERDSLESYNRGVELYHDRKWDKALDLFQSLEDDKLAQMYVKRILRFKKFPPQDDWTGITELTKK